MPSEENQTSEPPIANAAEPKPAIADPRDDLHEQMAAYRRDLQAYFARRRPTAKRTDLTRH